MTTVSLMKEKNQIWIQKMTTISLMKTADKTLTKELKDGEDLKGNA